MAERGKDDQFETPGFKVLLLISILCSHSTRQRVPFWNGKLQMTFQTVKLSTSVGFLRESQTLPFFENYHERKTLL